MKSFLKFFIISIVLMTLSSCGTEQIIVPDDDCSSDNIVYVSPADGTASRAVENANIAKN